jgi:DNA invertase Pin-like site-specific DNA recombinase
MQKNKVVIYLRVSTGQQAASGLGLAAQLQAVQYYAASVSASTVASFTEVESGKQNSRPELAKALHLAKVTGAVLVIAKLDRLSRNAAFLMNLAESGVRFVAADMPQANSLTVGIMALVAQQEGGATRSKSERAGTWKPKRGSSPSEGSQRQWSGSRSHQGQRRQTRRQPQTSSRSAGVRRHIFVGWNCQCAE